MNIMCLQSYLVRWVKVNAGHTIAWSVQPQKKSLNFGIFKHPNPEGVSTTSTPTTALPSSATSVASTFESAQTSTNNTSSDQQQASLPLGTGRNSDSSASTKPSHGLRSHGDGVAVVEKLQKIGLTCVAWIGRCEADKATEGSYDVLEGESGMYGLVFDNTFSKQTSKTVMFVLLTYPTKVPPRTGQDTYPGRAGSAVAAQASDVGGSNNQSSLGTGGTAERRANSPRLSAVPDSSESFARPSLSKLGLGEVRRGSSYILDSSNNMSTSTFHTGILQKKRRKRNQGYARRFFSLDFTSSTLSYYHDRHSSALRGSIPLSLAAIHANKRSRQISVDSGAEIWHLKASTARDFEVWKAALDKASSAIHNPAEAGSVEELDGPRRSVARDTVADDQEWSRVEMLVGRVVGTRDAVRRLAKDTDPKYHPPLVNHGPQKDNGLPSPGLTVSDSPENMKQEEGKSLGRTAFWRRKGSNQSSSPSSLFRRSSGQQVTLQPQYSQLSPSSTSMPKRENNLDHVSADDDSHEHYLAILRDLDAVVLDFSSLLSERRRRMASTTTTSEHSNSRMSIDSTSTMEFFDAQEDAGRRSRMSGIRQYSEESDEKNDDDDDDDDDDDGQSSSGDSGDSSDEEEMNYDRKHRTGGPSLFPERPKSLTPLPLERIKRRTTIPEPRVPPPSLISFLRKNVGKDLSTIAMPVTANEPLSLLQKLSEQFEYSELLDTAVNANPETGERLLYVTAFALSSFSSVRVKERTIRKPFNPMLGETYELIREDKGFRLLAEKVSHRPVRMAIQAESQHWTVLQSPAPVQKFWGKSAELNTFGRAHVILHSSSSAAPDGSTESTAAAAQGERYSWNIATSFLRNILAGEKYVEPVGSMTVVNEGTGAKAVVTFVKSSGMFSGRSEDVTVQVYGPTGNTSPLPLGLTGKWTSHLSLTQQGSDTGKKIWAVGPLVQNAPRCYGFPLFAAQLNEITAIESESELTGNGNGNGNKRNSNGSNGSNYSNHRSSGTAAGAGGAGGGGLHLPPTDSRLRPDQRAAETGDIERAEALKARLEDRQRSRRKVMEEHDEPWVPRWFVRAGGDGVSGGNGGVAVGAAGGGGGGGNSSGETDEIWKLKTGKDGYWEQRARGDWSCITDVFQV